MGVRINSHMLGWACCLVLAGFLTACDWEPVVNTHQQAFDLLKQEVLAKHMGELEAVGANASIFEDVEMHILGDQPCDKPRRYSTLFGLSINANQAESLLAKLFEIKNGSCDDCYDVVSVMASITRSGEVYKVRIRRKKIPIEEYRRCSEKWKLSLMEN